MMIDAVSKLLLALPEIDPQWLKEALRRGTLARTESYYDDPASALEAFSNFGGQGWLCTAERKKVEIIEDARQQRIDKEFPLWGELVTPGTSLHLRQAGEGWSLTTISDNREENGILLDKQLIGVAGTTLFYRVAYTIQSLNGLEELRPLASRFLGFSPSQGEELP